MATGVRQSSRAVLRVPTTHLGLPKLGVSSTACLCVAACHCHTACRCFTASLSALRAVATQLAVLPQAQPYHDRDIIWSQQDARPSILKSRSSCCDQIIMIHDLVLPLGAAFEPDWACIQLCGALVAMAAHRRKRTHMWLHQRRNA